MFLSPGPSQGRPWGPCWNGNPKNDEKKTKKNAFWTLFLRPIGNSFACFFNMLFFNVFWTSLFMDFVSQGHREGSILKHFGHQMQHFFDKHGKVKTAFSLERGHQNQAFCSLYFTAIYGLLNCCRNLHFLPVIGGIIHVILNLRIHLTSIFNPKITIRFTSFSYTLFHQIICFEAKLCWGHLRHITGKGGTGRHLGGLGFQGRPKMVWGVWGPKSWHPS